jgi:hypothetical protein
VFTLTYEGFDPINMNNTKVEHVTILLIKI